MKSYFRSKFGIFPFAPIVALRFEEDGYIAIFNAGDTDANGGVSRLTGADAARFVDEYTAWLDGQEPVEYSGVTNSVTKTRIRIITIPRGVKLQTIKVVRDYCCPDLNTAKNVVEGIMAYGARSLTVLSNIDAMLEELTNLGVQAEIATI